MFVRFLIERELKMQKVVCPYCKGEMFSASWEAGKVRCIYCGKQFFVGYDEIRQVWVSMDRSSPIQMVVVRKPKEKPKAD